jgi:hypothetical protein
MMEPKSRSRPHVRRFDDSRIGSDLSFHQGVKLSRIYRHRVDAQSRQFFPHITRLQYVESLLVKLLDNGLGCFGVSTSMHSALSSIRACK